MGGLYLMCWRRNYPQATGTRPGGVSNVDIAGNNALQIKAIGVVISTFETLPGIENKSHWVRDVTFDEDRSQVRCGNIPHMMAALRNTAIGLLRWAGHTNIAAACRRLAAQPAQALALIGIAFEN